MINSLWDIPSTTTRGGLAFVMKIWWIFMLIRNRTRAGTIGDQKSTKTSA